MAEPQDRRNLGPWRCGATIPASDYWALFLTWERNKNLSCLNQWFHRSLWQQLDMYTSEYTISLFSLHLHNNSLVIPICVILDIKKWKITNNKQFTPESHGRKVQITSGCLTGKAMFSHYTFPEEFIVLYRHLIFKSLPCWLYEKSFIHIINYSNHIANNV